MTEPTPIEQLLHQLRDVTIEISCVDLEEANNGLLFSLQNRQAKLRHDINTILQQEQRELTDSEKCYIADCIVLERQNLGKFEAIYRQSWEQLRNIRAGRQSKKLYSDEGEPYMGFFIDQHR
jgi:hypothetical protein